MNFIEECLVRIQLAYHVLCGRPAIYKVKVLIPFVIEQPGNLLSLDNTYNKGIYIIEKNIFDSYDELLSKIYLQKLDDYSYPHHTM